MYPDRLVASCGRRSRARAFVARAVSRKTLATAFAALSASVVSAAIVEAKGPGRTYCFYKTCHRVKTIAETEALVGKDMTLIASHYDSCTRDRFNPCGLTSSGERFAADRADNAASPVLPDGTIALVWSKASREAIVLRINNAGPYWGNRKLDLSRAAARRLGIGGVGEVTLRVLKAPSPAEARYVRNRVYERVPGPIGRFASLDAAHGAMSIMVADGAPRTTALAGLAAPVTTDPAVNLAAAYKSPVLPGFALPRGALAEALAAQSAAERRVVTAAAPPVETIAPSSVQASIDVVPVRAKVVRAAPVEARRLRVTAVEVAAKETTPAGSQIAPAAAPAVTALARAKIRVADSGRAERASKRGDRRNAAAERKQQKQARIAAAKPVVLRKSAPVAAAAVRPEPSSEIHVGFTTYAEARHQTKKKRTVVTKTAKPPVVRAPSPPAIAAVPSQSDDVKRAALPKAGRSANLKPAGSWQSSAVFEAPTSRPPLTGPRPAMPVDGLGDETETPRRPGWRAPSSALV